MDWAESPALAGVLAVASAVPVAWWVSGAVALLVAAAVAHWVVVPLAIGWAMKLQLRGARVAPFVPLAGSLAALAEALAARAPLRVRNGDRCTQRDGLTEWIVSQVREVTEDGSARLRPLVWWYGSDPRLVLFDRDAISDVLMREAGAWEKTPTEKAVLEPVIGTQSMLLVDNAVHRPIHRIVAPTFRSGPLRALVPMFAEAAARFCATMEDACAGGSVERDANEAMSRVTLDIIGVAAFGGDFGTAAGGAGADAETDADVIARGLVEVMGTIEDTMMHEAWRFGLPWLSRLVPSKTLRRQARAMQRIRRVVARVVRDRMAATARGAWASGKRPHDLLQLLVDAREADDAAAHGAGEADDADEVDRSMAQERAEPVGRASPRGERLSAQQVADQAVTFVLAGHETTAQLLTWALFLLTQHEEWRARAAAEVASVAAKRRDAAPSSAGVDCPFPTVEELGSMPVVGAILQETLRLFAPAPQVPRYAPRGGWIGPKRDSKLRGQGAGPWEGRVWVPPGGAIDMFLSVLHRDPTAWDDPDAFDPARWLSDEAVAALGLRRLAGPAPPGVDPTTVAHRAVKGTLPPCTFMPFMLGPRACVGRRLAQLEAQVVLAAVLARLDFRLPECGVLHAPALHVTQRPGHGMPMEWRRRDGAGEPGSPGSA